MVSLVLERFREGMGNVCTWKISKTIVNDTINDSQLNVVCSHKTNLFFVKVHKSFQGFEEVKDQVILLS